LRIESLGLMQAMDFFTIGMSFFAPPGEK